MSNIPPDASSPSPSGHLAVEGSPAFLSGLGFYDPALAKRLKDAAGRSDAGARAVLAALIDSADRALGTPLRTVLQKTECAPSGDPRDYHSLAPYWWPDPDTKDGIPYQRRDGERLPEADLRAPESLKFDVSRFQGVFDDVTVLAWAHHLTGRADYAEKALAVVRAWFLDEQTGMNPNLDYAQVRRVHRRNRGRPSGVMEAKAIAFLLDAVSLLSAAGAFPDEDRAALTDWCRRYAGWLESSDSGRKECAAQNNHGTCFEMQALSLAAFLKDADAVQKAVERCRGRLADQFTPDGRQPQEETRSIPLHYRLYNLQAWCVVIHLARRSGCDPAPPGSPAHRILAGAVRDVIHDVGVWRRDGSSMEAGDWNIGRRLGRGKLGLLVRAGATLFDIPEPAGMRADPHPTRDPICWELAFGWLPPSESSPPDPVSP